MTVTGVNDSVVNGTDRTATVSHSVSGADYGSVTAADVTVTTTDDDAGAITLATNPTSIAEDAGTTSVTVTATTDGSTFPADKTVTIAVGASGDSATSGTDYAAVTGFDITITAGEQSGSASFDLEPTDNSLDAADKTITVSGTSSDVTVATASIALTDDDATPGVNLVLSPTSVLEDAGSTSVTVTANLSTSVVFAEDKTVTVTVGDSGDSATSGTDYSAVSDFDITISKGDASGSATFNLVPTNNDIDEADKSITISGASTGLTVNSASLMLNDDDGTPSVNLAVNPSSVTEDAGATSVTVTASLSTSAVFAEDKTVTVKVGASGDSATSGTDYTAVADFDITITKGNASGSATFSLAPTDNEVDAADKSITVSGTSTGLSVNSASLTLSDDDGTPSVNLAVNPTSVAEDAGATSVTVTASLSTSAVFAEDKTVTVKVGATGDDATSGTDYKAVADFDITIAKGQGSGSATFSLASTDNNLDETDKSITVAGTSTGLTVNPVT